LRAGRRRVPRGGDHAGGRRACRPLTRRAFRGPGPEVRSAPGPGAAHSGQDSRIQCCFRCDIPPAGIEADARGARRDRKEPPPVKTSRSLLKYSLTVPLIIIPAAVVVMAPSYALAASDVTISGVVTDKNSGQKVSGALVIIQRTCLQG